MARASARNATAVAPMEHSCRRMIAKNAKVQATAPYATARGKLNRAAGAGISLLRRRERNSYEKEVCMQKSSVRVVCLCWLLALSVSAVFTQTVRTKKETLTNASVIELAKLGLSEALIIEKIRQSEHRFDTSVEGLKQLKAAQLSDALIAFILNPQAAPVAPSMAVVAPTATAKPAASGNTPAATYNPAGQKVATPLPPDKGVYLWDGKTMHLLHQSRVPSMGTSVWRSVTPFVKKKIELQMFDAHAKLQFDNNEPVIVVSGMGDIVPGVPSFRLLYVKTGGMRKDRRIVGTYDVGGFFGSVSMVDNEIECRMEKLAVGVYAFKPDKALPDGEYGVAHVPPLAAASTQPGFAPPIWDFGIYTEARVKE